jgi:hypothetical protein
MTEPASAIYPWLNIHLERVSVLLRQGRMLHALLMTGCPGPGKSFFAAHPAPSRKMAAHHAWLVGLTCPHFLPSSAK